MSPPQPAGPRLRVLELYSGLGGVAAALEPAVRRGHAEIVAAVDINPVALGIYRHNHTHPVRTANLESIPAAVYRDLGADLWWMSPPCQPFTRRGRRLDDRDPRARGFLRLVETLAEVKPCHVVLENVPGFGGSRTHGQLRQVLDRAGYTVRENVLCPTDFGVPNRRRRIYLVASRSVRPLAARPWSSLEETAPLGSFLDPVPETGLEVEPELLDRYRHAVDLVDTDDPRAVAATFTSAYGRSPVRSGSYLRQPDGTVRRFSPAEILRLLGFPPSFSLPPALSRKAAWRSVGSSLSSRPVRAVLATLPELAMLPELAARSEISPPPEKVATG